MSSSGHSFCSVRPQLHNITHKAQSLCIKQTYCTVRERLLGGTHCVGLDLQFGAFNIKPLLTGTLMSIFIALVA